MADNDLSVDGAYSPVSLRKFIALKSPEQEDDPIGATKQDLIRVLIDNTGAGIAMDDPYTIYVTPEVRLEQAQHYREHVFNGSQVSAHLFRYLRYMFLDADENDYPTNQSVADAARDGKLTEDSDDYKAVINLIKYSDHNVEAAQVIGFIQIFAGILNHTSKKKIPIRLFIQHPETGLHPKRTARFMSLFYKIQNDYGIKPTNDESH
jgi:hypothetical protein